MKTYLTRTNREELEADKRYFEQQLTNPLVQDKPMVRKNLNRVQNMLETQAPPEHKDVDIDKIVKQERELREEIVPNMLSQAEMRQAPPGSVGREMEFQKKFKNKILKWKNLRRIIYRDSDDPDVSNIEVFRPVVSQGNLDNALIPGKQFHFASPVYQEKYEDIEWRKTPEDESAETEASRDRRAELAALRARLAELESEDEDESETEEAPSRLGLEED